MRPSTSPGASPTHARVPAEASRRAPRRRAAAASARLRPARELDEAPPCSSGRRGGSRRPRRRGRARPASPARTAPPAGRPAAGGPSGSSPQSRMSHGHLALGVLGLAHVQPASGRAHSQRADDPSSPGDDDEPAVAAAGLRRLGILGAVGPVARRTRTSRARSCARGGRRRPSARRAARAASAARRTTARRSASHTAKPTSTPTRSISSNGPMRKPPPRRQMRSTSATVGDALLTSRSASSPNGRLQRFTRKPGPSAALMTSRPIASPRRAASVERRLAPTRPPRRPRASFITGAGLKKCMPTTCSGRGAAAAIAVTGSDEVFVASTAVGPTIAAERGEQLALQLEPLGRRLDDELAAPRDPSSVGGRLEPRARPRRPPLLQRPRCAPTPSAALERVRASGSWSSVRAPGLRRELRDAGAHRSGAEHADDVGVASQDDRVDAGRRAADDQLLDLRRALVERRHADVAEVALDRVVVDVARAAVHLDRGVRALHRRLGRVQLGDRRLGRRRAPLRPSAKPARQTQHPRRLGLARRMSAIIA